MCIFFKTLCGDHVFSVHSGETIGKHGPARHDHACILHLDDAILSLLATLWDRA
jgi:hypothetical protein